jgi:hypothetical protein
MFSAFDTILIRPLLPRRDLFGLAVAREGVLGVNPLIGRPFTEKEDEKGVRVPSSATDCGNGVTAGRPMS